MRPPAALPLRNDEAELAVVILRVRLAGVRRPRRDDVHDVLAAGDERDRYAARRRRPRRQRRHREARRVNEIRGVRPEGPGRLRGYATATCTVAAVVLSKFWMR